MLRILLSTGVIALFILNILNGIRLQLRELPAPQRFASSDVSPGTIPQVATAIVQWLDSGTDVAIVFRVVSEALGTVEWAALAVNAVAGRIYGVMLRSPTTAETLE